MSQRRQIVLWIAAVVVCCLFGVRALLVPFPRPALAQQFLDPSPGEAVGEPNPQNESLEPGAPDPKAVLFYDTVVEVSVHSPSRQQQMAKAIKALREAQSDEQKRVARDGLRKILSDIFTADMQAREKQAKEIETRLAKLRQQYQSRDKVKDDIIDLQLKVLEQDAAGLGFPNSTRGATDDSGRYTTFPPGVLPPPVAVPADPKAPPKPGFPGVVPRVEAVEPRATNRNFLESFPDLKPNETRPADPLSGDEVTRQSRRSNYGLSSNPANIALPYDGIVSEYNQLRSQYRKATQELQRTESLKDATVNGKPVPFSPQVTERARQELSDAKHLLDVKLQLLKLDLKAADIACKAVKLKYEQTAKLEEKKAVSKSEVDAQRALLEAAEVEVSRIQTLLTLFESIKTSEQAAPAAEGAANDPTQPPKQETPVKPVGF